MPTIPQTERRLDPPLISRAADGLRRQQTELVETVRTMRFALDDLCGALERQRQHRDELLVLLGARTREVGM